MSADNTADAPYRRARRFSRPLQLQVLNESDILNLMQVSEWPVIGMQVVRI